jgi:hypothetical protein
VPIPARREARGRTGHGRAVHLGGEVYPALEALGGPVATHKLEYAPLGVITKPDPAPLGTTLPADVNGSGALIRIVDPEAFPGLALLVVNAEPERLDELAGLPGKCFLDGFEEGVVSGHSLSLL